MLPPGDRVAPLGIHLLLWLTLRPLVQRCFTLFEHGARYLTPTVALIQNNLPNTAQRALIEERKGYEDAQNRSKDTQKTRLLSETRSLSEVVRSGTVGLRHVW